MLGSTVQTDQWVHITGVVDRLGGNAHLYVNGQQASTSTFSPGTLAADITAGDWVLGDSSQANVELDEVRLANVLRSGDWVKASYDNQKAGQSLLAYAQVT